MTGEKKARIGRCARCEHRLNSPGWSWPRCAGSGYDSGNLPRIELNDQYMEGADSNCPKGHWTGLEPIDLEARQLQQEQRSLELLLEHPFFRRLDDQEPGGGARHSR